MESLFPPPATATAIAAAVAAVTVAVARCLRHISLRAGSLFADSQPRARIASCSRALRGLSPSKTPDPCPPVRPYELGNGNRGVN